MFRVCLDLCFVQVETGAVFKLYLGARHLKDTAFLQREFLQVLIVTRDFYYFFFFGGGGY